MKNKVKLLCDGCNKMTRRKSMILVKGKLLCYKCRIKCKYTIVNIGRPLITLEEVKDKVYHPYVYIPTERAKCQQAHCRVSLPMCFAGKTIKIIVVEEKNEADIN